MVFLFACDMTKLCLLLLHILRARNSIRDPPLSSSSSFRSSCRITMGCHFFHRRADLYAQQHMVRPARLCSLEIRI
ncbi:hypothetical protein B0H63DRAFT_459582 [Podospora didyma]|uniref:Secreted protein n=1 Tax=Podospora didyma TaxID=330526 RepID=A0AAE0P5Y5_9PEZI|nr:hypothetical protein B0H63DRAFT_459582 [Podospora didyma]